MYDQIPIVLVVLCNFFFFIYNCFRTIIVISKAPLCEFVRGFIDGGKLSRFHWSCSESVFVCTICPFHLSYVCILHLRVKEEKEDRENPELITINRTRALC